MGLRLREKPTVGARARTEAGSRLLAACPRAPSALSSVEPWRIVRPTSCFSRSVPTSLGVLTTPLTLELRTSCSACLWFSTVLGSSPPEGSSSCRERSPSPISHPPLRISSALPFPGTARGESYGKLCYRQTSAPVSRRWWSWSCGTVAASMCWNGGPRRGPI